MCGVVVRRNNWQLEFTFKPVYGQIAISQSNDTMTIFHNSDYCMLRPSREAKKHIKQINNAVAMVKCAVKNSK